MGKLKIILLAASLLLAMSLTLSCSSGGGGGGSPDNSDVSVPKQSSVDGYLNAAIADLRNEKWDEAVANYNAAYKDYPNDASAVIYSTLANLAKISTDPKVQDLIKNHLGFTEYPNKLNALFSDEWMKETPYIEWDYYDSNVNSWVYWYSKGEYAGWCATEEISVAGYYYCKYTYNNYNYDYEFVRVSTTPKTQNERLPNIKTPDWIKGNGSLYNSYLINNAFSVDNWALSLIANVIDKHSSGFNGLLDDVIEAVFGTSYNTAVDRLKKLESRKEDRITLDPYFIDKLGLEEVIDETDKIGWAEVNAILSAVLAVKASFEWLQTYDLSTDLNWLKFAWQADDEAFEKDLTDRFKKLDKSKVPFNNNFLKQRSGKSMDNAKATYTKAVEGLQASFTSIQTSDLYPKEVKDAYPAINDGFDKLKAAIKTPEGKFYIPKDDPTKIKAWPTTSDNTQATINIGKFFTPGYFSLDNIFKTNNGKPVFYAREENEVPVDYEYCYDDYEYIPIEICENYDGEEYCYNDYERKPVEVCYTNTYYNYSYTYTELNNSNYTSLLSNGGRLSLALDMNKIKALADNASNEFEYIVIGFSGDIAKALFEKYYK
jgi:hypothetical protein